MLGYDEYEARRAILDFKARARRIDQAGRRGGRREPYELWMRRIDRMDIWGTALGRSGPSIRPGNTRSSPNTASG